MRKIHGKNGSLQNTSMGLKRSDFCDFKTPRKNANQKEKMSPMSKARRKAGQNKFAEKGRMPDIVGSFGEFDSSQESSQSQARVC